MSELTLDDVIAHWNVSATRLHPTWTQEAKIQKWEEERIEAYLTWLRHFCRLVGAPDAIDGPHLIEELSAIAPRLQSRFDELLQLRLSSGTSPTPLPVRGWEREVPKRMGARVAPEAEVGAVVREALRDASAVAVVDPYFMAAHDHAEATRQAFLDALPHHATVGVIAGFSAWKKTLHRDAVAGHANEFAEKHGGGDVRKCRILLLAETMHPIHDRLAGVCHGAPREDLLGCPEMLQPDHAFTLGPGLRVVLPGHHAMPSTVALVHRDTFARTWSAFWAEADTSGSGPVVYATTHERCAP